MAEKITLRVASKEDREAIAVILFRNGYRVEPAKVKVNKTFRYLVLAEPLETIDITSSQEEAPDAC